jgi:5'-nucleotidase
MVKSGKPQILLTNDDGIRSPGLWALAAALAELGFVSVAAPRDQSSSTGRSMPTTSDGRIVEEEIEVEGQRWSVFAIGGTPSQAVQHAVVELMEDEPPALVVSGINYGENVSTSVSISGTVGAAMEGASYGIPAMAASLEVDRSQHLSHSETVDFRVAAHFTKRFARILLEGIDFPDVDLLKVDVPSDATLDTPWKITHLERSRYFVPLKPERESWDSPAIVGYEMVQDLDRLTPGSDAHTLRVLRQVAVTPLSLDMTSRVDFEALRSTLQGSG